MWFDNIQIIGVTILLMGIWLFENSLNESLPEFNEWILRMNFLNEINEQMKWMNEIIKLNEWEEWLNEINHMNEISKLNEWEEWMNEIMKWIK